MAIIDNTLAAQVPTFDPAVPLQQAAQLQAAQTQDRAAQYKQMQTEIGSEARGLVPFVNTPEFPAKWAETADRMLDKGLLNPQTHQQWRNTPSPLLLKQMIAQTEDPTLTFRKDEAARDQKNTLFNQGIATRQQNRLDAAANDQTPDGFEANPAFKTDPSQPQYRPLSGGPQDPNYLQSAAAAKAKIPRIIAPGESVVDMASGKESYKNVGGTGAGIDDETADFLAKRSLQGDTRALVGLGRGAQGAENILKIQQRATAIAKDQGIDASGVLANIATQAGVTSEARALGTKSAHFGVAEKAMEESLPIALAASKEVPRTQWKALTEAIQTGQTQFNDPKLKKFAIATDTAVKDYARTINPSGQTREGDITYARKLLSTADSPEAFEAGLEQLKVEAGVTKRAIQRQKEEVRTGGKSEVTQGKSGDAILSQARDAIARGAPRDKVMERLKQNGVDASGL